MVGAAHVTGKRAADLISAFLARTLGLR